MKNPLVANLVANSHPASPATTPVDVRLPANGMNITLCPTPELPQSPVDPTISIFPKPKRRSAKVKAPPVRGLFQHARSGIWYWRFSHQGRRYAISLKTSDPVQARLAALQEQAKLFGTDHRRANPAEKAAYVTDVQVRQGLRTLKNGSNGVSVFDGTGFVLWYQNFNKVPGRHRASTVWRTASQLKNFFLELNVKDVRQITPQSLSQWRDSKLQKASAKGVVPGLKAATSIATVYRNVRAAMSQAANPAGEGGAGVIPFNPLSKWKPFTRGERKRLAAERERHILPPKLTVPEYQALLEKAEAYPKREDGQPQDPFKVAAAIAVWLMATGGLRWTEVQFARWENVNWERHWLKLMPTEYFTTKSGRARIIPLPSKTIEFLVGFRQKAGFILPTSSVETEGLANKYDRVGIRPHVEKIIEQTCLARKISPHGLRHVFVTLCRESGISRDEVQAAVGHSSGLVTAIYDHSEPDARTFDALPMK